MIPDDVKFHADRAMAELDLAIRAACVDAARSHFTLSALHLEKMRALSGSSDPADSGFTQLA